MTALDPDELAATRSAGSGVTTSARATIDLTSLPAEPRWSRDIDDTAAYLLRLCLDLQLDALLLTIGAAAAQQVRDDSSTDRTPSGSPPWLRWVEEDVDLAATLAADALAGRATLPATLGTDLDHSVPATVVDNLVARYESMRDLLSDTVNRDTSPHADRWRLQIRAARHRCQTRLAELHAFRLAETPPRGLRIDASAPSATASPLAPEHHYLPGELLG